MFGSLLLAGGCIFGMAQTAKAQVVLEQKNIHFRENYSKGYADNVTIKLTSTGTTSQQNYSQENFTPNEGTASGVEEPGIGSVLWEQSKLDLKKDLSITVKPVDFEGSKIEMDREGIHIRDQGTMHVGGDTTIFVDNYWHTDAYPPVAADEDYGMNSQKGISLSGEEAFLDLDGNLDITMLNGNRSMGILAQNSANLTVGGDTTIVVKDAPYYTYGIANRYNDPKYSLAGYSADDANLHFEGDLNITTVGGNNSIGINLQDTENADSAITVNGHLSINASGAQRYNDRGKYQEFPNAVSNYGIFLNGITNATFNSADIATTSTGSGVESIGTYLYWYSNATLRVTLPMSLKPILGTYPSQPCRGPEATSTFSRA